MLHTGLLYRIFPISDHSLTIDFGNIIDESLNKRVTGLFHHLTDHPFPGMIEAVPAYCSLSIYYDTIRLKKENPQLPVFEQVKKRMEQVIAENIEIADTPSKLVTIPVCYDAAFGPDLENIAHERGISVQELIQIHYDTIYRVYMNGFMPGFAYMGEVDKRIAIPRHKTPRQIIEAGSVGIAGKQTGIYPLDSPGGWQIIGKTPLALFNKNIPQAENNGQLALLQPGDKVQFYPVSTDEFEKIQRQQNRTDAPGIAETAARGIRIKKPGLLTSIQDTGRNGFRYLGINPGGAMDKTALLIGNALVGNPAKEAGMEIFFPGPEIIFDTHAIIAVTGADFTPCINGEKISLNQPVLIDAGSELSFARPVSGHCCYLSINGGFDIQSWLGSKSTHLKAGAGGWQGRPLKKEDIIHLLKVSQLYNTDLKEQLQSFSCKIHSRENEQAQPLRVIPGKEWNRLRHAAQDCFTREGFTISTIADRMGYRLKGSVLEFEHYEELVSSAVDFGTIQLLPDGQMIILMADHQTTGGYPRIAHVISADHSLLAQKRPGEKIFFQLTDIKTAEEKLAEQDALITWLQSTCEQQLKELLSF